MKFASFRQMTVMALAWAVLLVSYDHHKNPRPARAYWAEFVSGHPRPALEKGEAGRPHLSIVMNHLCCSGCLSDVRAALAPLTWLGRPTVNEITSQEDADLSGMAPEANRLEIDVVDVGMADFVALDRALRDAGFAADRMELSGIPHFQLEAEVKHICCTTCSTSLGRLGDLLHSYHQGWVEGVSVNKNDRKIVASVKYNSAVDVMGLIAGLNVAGFSPHAIRVVFET